MIEGYKIVAHADGSISVVFEQFDESTARAARIAESWPYRYTPRIEVRRGQNKSS